MTRLRLAPLARRPAPQPAARRRVREAIFNRHLVGNNTTLGRNVAAIGVEKSMINKSRMILGISPNFDDTFQKFINKSALCVILIFFPWQRSVSIKAWKRILRVLVRSMGAAFDESVAFPKTAILAVDFNEEFHQRSIGTENSLRRG